MTIFEDLGNHLISTLAGAFTLCESSSAHFLFFTSRGAESTVLAKLRKINYFIINGL